MRNWPFLFLVIYNDDINDNDPDSKIPGISSKDERSSDDKQLNKDAPIHGM